MDEIIQAVTEAENNAAQMKAQASEKAAKIVAQAEQKAQEILKASETECKEYREREIKKATENAENAYFVALSEKRAEAKAYADDLLKDTKTPVGRIVRRICG